MVHTPATLTGLAIGDALGMPFETHKFDSPALMAWDGSFQSGKTNNIQPHMDPGQWTDDTKMARALAESLVECDTYSPVAAASAYVNWYYSGDHRGMGKATKKALERIVQGRHWVDSGILGAQGNGTAMRVAPLGLFYRHSPGTAAEMARIDARITHQDIEAEVGASAVATAVALLAAGKFYKRELIPKTLFFTGFDSAVAEKLCDVRDFVAELQPENAVKGAFKRLLEMGTGAHVVQTVPAAFLCFLVTESFTDAVELAVRAGGDTDTTAAITGALAGTHYGVESVASYLEDLEDAERLQHLDNLLRLGAPYFREDV